MKILIYGLHFKPDLIGIGKYTGEMADWLHDNNHEIRVITAPHFYPEWKEKPKQYRYKKNIDPYITWRCPIFVPAKPRALTRLLHLISFTLSSIPVLLKNISWKPDYIISIEPPFLTSPLTLIYSKLTKSKPILHIQDLEIDAAYSLDILKKGLFFKFIIIFEKYILSKFLIVSTISEGMRNKINQKGIDDNKLYILPNWADLETINPNIDNSYLRKQLSIKSTNLTVLYSGNIGEKQNLESIVNVAERMQNNGTKITFLIVGDGAAKNRLEKDVINRNIKNIVFLPLQPNADFGALLTIADIHLVTQDKNIIDYVLPSKLSNIFSAGGVTIIASDKGSHLSNMVDKYKIGLLIKPGSDDELFNSINFLINNISKRNIISKNAFNYAKKYLNKERILNDFNSVVLSK